MNRVLLAFFLVLAAASLSGMRAEGEREARYLFRHFPFGKNAEVTFLFRSGVVCEPPESRGVCYAACLSLARLAAREGSDVIALRAEVSISLSAVAFDFLCPLDDAPALAESFARALARLPAEAEPRIEPVPRWRFRFPSARLAAAFPGNALFDWPPPPAKFASLKAETLRTFARSFLSPRCLTVICRAARAPAGLGKVVTRRLAPRGKDCSLRSDFLPRAFSAGTSDGLVSTPGGWLALDAGESFGFDAVLRAFLARRMLERTCGPLRRVHFLSAAGRVFALFEPPPGVQLKKRAFPLHDGTLSSDMAFARAWAAARAFLARAPSDPALLPDFLGALLPARSAFPDHLARFEAAAAGEMLRPEPGRLLSVPLGGTASLWCLPPPFPGTGECVVLASGWSDGLPLTSRLLAGMLAAGPASLSASDASLLKGLLGLVAEPVEEPAPLLAVYPAFAAAKISAFRPAPGFLARWAAAALSEPREVEPPSRRRPLSPDEILSRVLWPDYRPPQGSLSLSHAHVFLPGGDVPGGGIALPVLDAPAPSLPPIPLEETALPLPPRPAVYLIWRRAPQADGFEFPLAALMARLKENLPAGTRAGCYLFPWGSVIWALSRDADSARSAKRLFEATGRKDFDDEDVLETAGELETYLWREWSRPFGRLAWGVMLHPRGTGPFFDERITRPDRFALSAAAARFFGGRFQITGLPDRGREGR